MTFEEWWEHFNSCCPLDITDEEIAKWAWDAATEQAQDRIDRLEASWRDDDSLTTAYLRGFSDGKKAAQEQE